MLPDAVDIRPPLVSRSVSVATDRVTLPPAIDSELNAVVPLTLLAPVVIRTLLVAEPEAKVT